MYLAACLCVTNELERLTHFLYHNILVNTDWLRQHRALSYTTCCGVALYLFNCLIQLIVNESQTNLNFLTKLAINLVYMT